jgi:phage shock protein A
MAALKRQEQQYNQGATQAQEWEKRAMLALQKGDENLAREALSRKKTHADSAATLKVGLDQQTGQVEALKKNLIVIEGKISEAKTQKEMLKARLQSAKAQENLNNMLGKVNTNSAAATFERMEQKVLMQEARASASSELGMDNLESQFAQLEAGNGVDDELAALKAKMVTGSPAPQGVLPPSDAAKKPSVGAAIDAELEALRRQMG